jgi:ADP-ribose pyrophosphatase YjhB (NUDIX family)
MEFREDQDIRINNIQCRGFIIKQKQILVMYRKKNNEEYYVFPGGHMRQGETPEQTVTREIEEETTVQVQNLKMAYEITDYSNNKVHKEYYFIGEWLSGDPILSGEESRRNSSENFFKPMFIDFSEISKLLIYPAQAKEWVELNIMST